MSGKGEGPAIGINLGTTYSCVGVWEHDHVEIIANDQGNRTTPSYNRLLNGGVFLRVILSEKYVKRLIGRRFSDPSVQSDMKHWPFENLVGIIEI